MKKYRSLGITDLSFDGKNLWVLPKKCNGKDSTIPAGNWTFWFDGPIALPNTPCVVAADFEPVKKGIMTFCICDAHLGDLWYEIPEIVTDKPVRIEKLVIDPAWVQNPDSWQTYHCPITGKTTIGGEEYPEIEVDPDEIFLSHEGIDKLRSAGIEVVLADPNDIFANDFGANNLECRAKLIEQILPVDSAGIMMGGIE